jgi:hypothetical protein
MWKELSLSLSSILKTSQFLRSNVRDYCLKSTNSVILSPPPASPAASPLQETTDSEGSLCTWRMAISFGWRVPATQDDQAFSSLSFPSLRFLGVGKTRWIHQQMSETRQAHQKQTKWSSKCSLSRKGLLSQRSAAVVEAFDSITRHQSSRPLVLSFDLTTVRMPPWLLALFGKFLHRLYGFGLD